MEVIWPFVLRIGVVYLVLYPYCRCFRVRDVYGETVSSFVDEIGGGLVFFLGLFVFIWGCATAIFVVMMWNHGFAPMEIHNMVIQFALDALAALTEFLVRVAYFVWTGWPFIF